MEKKFSVAIRVKVNVQMICMEKNMEKVWKKLVLVLIQVKQFSL